VAPDRLERSAFSLIESMIGVGLLAIASVAVVGPICASHQQRAQAEETTTAAALARELMQEIAARPFVDPNEPASGLGKDTGESERADFDNLDDFHGYHDTTAALQTIDGVSITSETSGVYSRDVLMEYRSGPAGPAAPTGDFLAATVTVTTPSGQAFALQRVFARYTRR
jgi:hypothetical protein